MLLHFILCLFTFPSTMAFGTLQGSNSSAMNNIAKPGCQTHCGNISVPYPFGIGEDTGCALNDDYFLTCNSTNGTSKLFLGSSTIDIFNISDSEFRTTSGVAYRCYRQNGDVFDEFHWWTRLNRVLTLSEKNKFTVIGCDDFALVTGSKRDRYSSGCFGLCSNLSDVPAGECSGKGCCQTSITKGLKFYNVTLNSFQNHTEVWSINRCGLAFLAEENTFRFGGASDLNNSTDLIRRLESSVLVVIDWVIGHDRNCSQATECKENSECHDADGGGYHCRCKQGYEGNPYLDQGCQDINECEDPRTYPCYGICNNTPGGYNCSCLQGAIGDAKIPNNCSCPLGYNGDPKIQNGCKAAKDSKSPSNEVIIATVVGLIAIVCATMMGIFFSLRRRKLMRLREKFFEQNGGALLKQKINSHGTHDTMTLFSSMQLRKATNNYSQEQIVGRGGYGVVYKGVLSDNRVVAIKKSKIVDGSQAEQFINELLILTQVIHRNVVKLLGCCLEEEVPVLVYEFISNNTLYHHIHHKLGGMSWLSWENRLRIAAEAASALAYLHSETIMPIIHRDVKSANILLDDNYTVKVSDFGASRLVPLDHEQVTTLIQGTLGYLDPQYYHTSQLTEKSDVYSFGVVLAELLTGKIPIGSDRINEEKNLATYFVNLVKENRLFEIVEPRLLREGTLDKLHTLANLVKRCLSLQSHDRPTMKEVAMELDGLRKFTTHPWIPETSQEARSLVLEVEQSDLYDAPLVSYGPNESDSYLVGR